MKGITDTSRYVSSVVHEGQVPYYFFLWMTMYELER